MLFLLGLMALMLCLDWVDDDGAAAAVSHDGAA
jgi:hypothetical protein